MNARHILAGLGWSSIATAVNLAAQFGFMALLARVLEPAAFGLMAMAAIATRFASFFAQAGAAQTLVQQATLDRALTTAAFWLSLAVSGALYAVTWLAAPLFSRYFQAPELVAVLRLFGLTLPLAALGALPLALLRRQGRFAAAALIDVSGYVLGYGLTGTVMALQGQGVWSLVAASLCQQALSATLAFGLARYPLGGAVPRATWQQVLGQGSRYSLIGFLEFLWANVETLLIGRRLGQAALGLQNRAQLLCNLPVEQTVNASSKVLFPALSAMQTDRARVADGFLLMLLATGVLSSALSAGISAAAVDAVGLLLGGRWQAAVPLVAVLAASVPAMFAYVACGITLDSQAALGPKLRLQATLLLVKLAAVLALSQWGLIGIAWAIVACEWLRAALGMALVSHLLHIPATLLWRTLGMLAAVLLTVYGAVSAAVALGQAMALPLAVRVLADALSGALGFMLLLVFGLPVWSRFSPLQRFDTVRAATHRAVRWIQRDAAVPHPSPTE